jgi:hypothetical protein
MDNRDIDYEAVAGLVAWVLNYGAGYGGPET